MKLDVTSSDYKVAVAIPPEKQFNSPFQKQMLSSSFSTPTLVGGDNSHQHIADAFIRPEVMLKERERNWKYCASVISDLKKFKAAKLFGLA